MHNAAVLPLPETSDTLPPEPDAALCGPHPVELPSPRASHYRVLDAALPDLSLSNVLRLLAFAAVPGNAFSFSHYDGNSARREPYFAIDLSIGIPHQRMVFANATSPDEAVNDAFERLARGEFAGEGPVDVHDPERESDEAAFDRYMESY